MVATSSKSISERILNVYPNPANHELNIIHDFYGNTEYTVFNMAGQPVLKVQSVEQNGLNKQTLNIGHLLTGMYSIQVRSGADVQTMIFLKK